jgi:hypothetical protein
VTGHLPDIGYVDPGAPMDFHAYFEVYLGQGCSLSIRATIFRAVAGLKPLMVQTRCRHAPASRSWCKPRRAGRVAFLSVPGIDVNKSGVTLGCDWERGSHSAVPQERGQPCPREFESKGNVEIGSETADMAVRAPVAKRIENPAITAECNSALLTSIPVAPGVTRGRGV